MNAKLTRNNSAEIFINTQFILHDIDIQKYLNKTLSNYKLREKLDVTKSEKSFCKIEYINNNFSNQRSNEENNDDDVISAADFVINLGESSINSGKLNKKKLKENPMTMIIKNNIPKEPIVFSNKSINNYDYLKASKIRYSNKNLLKNEVCNNIIIFFVDKSTKEGSILLNYNMKHVVFENEETMISVYIYEIDEDISVGINNIKEKTEKYNFIKVVLCCPNKSIYPFIYKLNENKIELNKIIFCILELQGNIDLSYEFGFNNYISNNILDFKKLIYDIYESSSISIDLWEVLLVLDKDYGEIYYINEDYEKVNEKKQFLNKGFISYLSLGYDSRIGFGMSKKNTSNSKFCHYVNYLCELTKKACCTKTLNLNNIIDKFYTIIENDNISENSSDIKSSENIETVTETSFKEEKKICIFQTATKKILSDNIEESDEEINRGNSIESFKYKNIELKSNTLGLICQNIKHFINGNKSIWETDDPIYGIHTINNNLNNESEKEHEKKDKKYFNNIYKNAYQSISDQSLEFFTYTNLKEITSQKKERIYSGKGPFLITFKDTSIYDKNDKYNRIYMNIDGNYLNIVKPIKLIIKQSKINKGQIKFCTKLDSS